MRKRRKLKLLTCLFWIVVFTTLIYNKVTFSGCDPLGLDHDTIVHGKRLCDSFVSNSISYYVAHGSLSAIAFLAVNFIYAIFVWKNINLKNGFQNFVLKVILICLIGLSIFPYGYVEFPIHEGFARTMFVLMGIFAGLIFLDRKYSRKVRILNLIFVAYAIFCGTIFLYVPVFFWSYNLIFEIIYLGFFSILIQLVNLALGSKKVVVK